MKQKGRTTKYDTIIKPKLEEIKKWSQSGATGKQIAGNLGIAESTLYKYKDEHQELASAIDDGRKSLVIELRGALIQKALGIKTTGITPAPAGKTTRFKRVCARVGDHPRTCGENVTYKNNTVWCEGSPPHLRGKPHVYILR